MIQTRWWDRRGAVVVAQPKRSLAAFLGHQSSTQQLIQAGVQPVTLAELAQEREFDPNPHRLKLPDEYMQTKLLIRGLASWGCEALLRAAVACAELQMARQPPCDATLRHLRDTAKHAAIKFIEKPDAERRACAMQAAAACMAIYRPFENQPDSDEGKAVWYQLGASWFAAETAAEDSSLGEWDGPGPAAASSTWRNRMSVWPAHAAEAAAYWSSHGETQQAIQAALLAWALA